jgi:mercuric ion transport protein
LNAKRLVVFGIAGAGLTAVCCFTPALVGLLGLVGLGAVVGYLDWVLLPALIGFLGLALYGLSRRNQEGGSLCCEGKEQGESWKDSTR